MRVTGVVMAGGRSSRFGSDKALLEVGGRTLLQRSVDALRSVTSDVIVLGPPERQQQAAGAVVLEDEVPGIGPLGGILTALRARPGDAALVVAVDMPFLSAALLRHLASLAGEADVVLPVVDDRGQQLHAVYGPGCLPYLEAQVTAGDYKIDRFFSQVRVLRLDEADLRRFDPTLRSFRNVNTREAWDAIVAEIRDTCPRLLP